MRPETPTDLALSLLPAAMAAWVAYDLAVVRWLGPRWGVPTITRRVDQLTREYRVFSLGVGLVVGWLLAHLWQF